MKKFITILSSFALIGSVSYAMEEGDDMGMEMEAPSVSVSGSAAIGIKNDSSADNSISLIREYKVAFSSSGTTDGGLMFGAGISIEDTHDDDPDKSVNGANVYIGGADGSWKVKFGGNDPGIENAGGIGVSDDHFGGGEDATIGFYGNFGSASVIATIGDPSHSVGTMPSMPTKVISSGLDSASLLNLGDANDDNDITPGTGGVLTFVQVQDILEAYLGVAEDSISAGEAAAYLNKHKDNAEQCGFTFTDVPPDNPSADYSPVVDDNEVVYSTDGTRCYGSALDPTDEFEDGNYQAYADSKAADGNWSIGFGYQLDTVNIGVGMDSHSGLAIGLGTELSGIGLNLFYSKSEFDDYVLGRRIALRNPKADYNGNPMAPDTGENAVVGDMIPNDDYNPYEIKSVMGSQENSGLGLKASMEVGEGTTFAVGYSTLKMEQTASEKEDAGYNGEATTKLVEIDFTYDLGGGASLSAGIDKKDAEDIKGVSTDTTTLEAKISMSF